MGYLWLLDPGHGEDTPGKRSPVWEGGRQLLEYEFNRAIVRQVAERLRAHRIPHVNLVPELQDVHRRDRVRRINGFVGGLPPFVVSVHANAAQVPETGTGWEVWTSPGETDSDKLASILYRHAGDLVGLERRHDYSDGDPDREARFTLLMCDPPAALVECGFMNTLHDCEMLMSQGGRDAFAAVIIDSILEVEECGLTGA